MVSYSHILLTFSSWLIELLYRIYPCLRFTIWSSVSLYICSASFTDAEIHSVSPTGVCCCRLFDWLMQREEKQRQQSCTHLPLVSNTKHVHSTRTIHMTGKRKSTQKVEKREKNNTSELRSAAFNIKLCGQGIRNRRKAGNSPENNIMIPIIPLTFGRVVCCYLPFRPGNTPVEKEMMMMTMKKIGRDLICSSFFWAKHLLPLCYTFSIHLTHNKTSLMKWRREREGEKIGESSKQIQRLETGGIWNQSAW